MRKYFFVTALASLCFITSQVYAASQPPKDTIWEYKGEGGKILWQACGGQNGTCQIVGSTRHYVAILNHKSASGCAFGDFYIVARTDGYWQQQDTGTCSPDAYISKGYINNGQYSSVDIGVNGITVKQFPIGYWSMQKELSGKKRPRWKEKDRTQGGVKTNMERYERMTKYGHLTEEEYQKIKQKEKK